MPALVKIKDLVIIGPNGLVMDALDQVLNLEAFKEQKNEPIFVHNLNIKEKFNEEEMNFGEYIKALTDSIDILEYKARGHHSVELAPSYPIMECRIQRKIETKKKYVQMVGRGIRTPIVDDESLKNLNAFGAKVEKKQLILLGYDPELYDSREQSKKLLSIVPPIFLKNEKEDCLKERGIIIKTKSKDNTDSFYSYAIEKFKKEFDEKYHENAEPFMEGDTRSNKHQRSAVYDRTKTKGYQNMRNKKKAANRRKRRKNRR